MTGDGGLSVPDLQMANESKSAIDSIRIGYWQLVDRELNQKLRQLWLSTSLRKSID